MRPRWSPAVHAAALAFFAGLALAFLWPLPAHLRTHYAVRTLESGSYVGDLYFSSWILASDIHQLVRDPFGIFETNNLHPFRHTLAYGENMIGVALLVLPVHLIWDDATLTHNAAVLLSLVLLGWGTFLLVSELSGSAVAGLLAGALVLYSPAVWAEIILLPVLAGYWTPIALFLLVRLTRAPSWRTAALLGVAVAFQAWSSLQHGLFLALGLAVTAVSLVVLSRHGRRAALHIAGAGVLAGALCIPLVLPYRAVRSEMEVEGRYGAMSFSLSLDRVRPPFDRPVAYLRERARSGEHVQGFGTLAPWILIAAGAVAAVVRPRRRDGTPLAVAAALAAGGLANLLYALGPMDDPWIPNLYRSLAELVPGLAWVRVPMRAVSYCYLVLCALAGSGAAALLSRLPWAPVRRLLVAAVLALIVLEAGWHRVPLLPAPPRPTALAAALAKLEPDCAIAEIPADINTSAEALLRSTTHWRPIINGYSGFSPFSPFVMYALLNQFPSPDALAFVRASGGCAVVVRPPAVPAVLAASRIAGLHAEAVGSDLLVRVPPAPPEPPGRELPRTRWRVASEAGPAGPAVLDGDLETLWRGSVRDDAGPDRLTVDLGEPVTVSAIAIDLGRHFSQQLRTYRVEGSFDGTTWTTLAEALIALPPVVSYRLDYRRVRQRIDFPAARVRWLRVGPYRRPPRVLSAESGWAGWGVAEFLAFGPPA